MLFIFGLTTDSFVSSPSVFSMKIKLCFCDWKQTAFGSYVLVNSGASVIENSFSRPSPSPGLIQQKCTLFGACLSLSHVLQIIIPWRWSGFTLLAALLLLSLCVQKPHLSHSTTLLLLTLYFQQSTRFQEYNILF